MEIVCIFIFRCVKIFINFAFFASNYPPNRVAKDNEGKEKGVPGALQLLQNVGLSTQPLSSLDWSPDKIGLGVSTAFDQTLRVIVVTKLNTL
jgi:hypothetical protein